MENRSILGQAFGAIIGVAAAMAATMALAQMDNGPKTEKKYGIGLPRDHATQLFSDADYPVFPLKPGQESYRDIDAVRMKKDVIALSSIALHYRGTVNKQWWGRFPGTEADRAGMKYMTDEFAWLGLKVETFPYVLPRDWRPSGWSLGYTSSKGAKIELATAFPVSGTNWRRSRFPRPRRQGQGCHHLQHIRSWRPQPFGFRSRRPVQRQCARPTARRRHGRQCDGGAGQWAVPA